MAWRGMKEPYHMHDQPHSAWMNDKGTGLLAKLPVKWETLSKLYSEEFFHYQRTTS